MEKYLCGNTRFRVHAAEKRHKERLEEKVIGREGKTDWGKNHLEFAPKLDWCREAAVKEKKELVTSLFRRIPLIHQTLIQRFA